MHTCLRIGLVVPALLVLACNGGGGGTEGPDSGETSGTTQSATTGGPQTTGTTGEPGDPTTSTSTSTSTSSTTGEPGTSTTSSGSSGGTSEDPNETTGGSTGAGSTGAVEPGPEHIPEIPDDGMPSSAHFTKHPLGSTDAMQGFWEYLPPGYGGGEKYPLLVFLHGIGENGNGDSELDKVPNAGIPALMKKDQWPTDRPFVVLSPQHPGGGCHTAAEIHALFEFALSHYDINPARVYLTGLSCGAIGSWNYLGEHLDEQIVAMVPIAGDGKGAFGKQGCMLGKVPIWAFHGDKDDVVNFSGTTQPIEGLQACDPKPEAEMVIYPDVKHDSWSMTYDLSAGHDIYAWLLEHYKQ
jgi:predicted esterase